MPRPPRFVLTLATVLAGVALAIVAVGALAQTTPSDHVSALREGNRLYREGRLTEARDAYLAGYSTAGVHPVLAYNLATTEHHLGRLPEAILWYRRAEMVNAGDPWLQENLGRARAALGLQPYPAPGVAGFVAGYASALTWVAVALAWLGLVLFVLRPRRPARGALVLLALGVTVYGGLRWLEDAAPRAAVVLADCSVPAGDLPAGSEVWITAVTDDNTHVAAGTLTLDCPRAGVAPVAPGD